MKTIIKQFAILALLIFLQSCSDEKVRTKIDDPAKEYCSCMKKNGSLKSYKYAAAVCKGELIQKCRLYKLGVIDDNDRSLRAALSDQLRDTISNFGKDFYRYTSENCCDITLNCHPDAVK